MSKVTEIKGQIERIEKGITNPVVAEGMKEGMRKKVAELKADLAKEEAAEEARAVEKKTKARKQIMSKAPSAPKKFEIPEKPKPVVEKPVAVAKPVKIVRVKKKVKQVKSKAKSIKTIRIPKSAARGKKRVKTFKVPKYVKRFNTGRGMSDLKRDSQRTAMAPGKHKQKRGSKHKFYYEKRANRTDVSPTKWKLNEGGNLSDAKFNIGDKVLYTQKLSGFDNSKPLVISGVVYNDGTGFGDINGHYYTFENSSLRSHEKDLRAYKMASGGLFGSGRSNAALGKDRKYFNERQKHEVDYAKSTGRKKVRYKAEGGSLYKRGGSFKKKA